MLSDEEKKAIDLLKNIDKQKCMMFECPVVKNNIERQLKIIELNRTIRKQSKEIEELNDKIKAKIEEVQKRLKEETRTDFLIILKILENELQSLLEKE